MLLPSQRVRADRYQVFVMKPWRHHYHTWIRLISDMILQATISYGNDGCFPVARAMHEACACVRFHTDRAVDTNHVGVLSSKGVVVRMFPAIGGHLKDDPEDTFTESVVHWNRHP